MPIYKRTIKYYTCKFKCGHKADPKYKIEKHEEYCFCNPKNKACRICKNFIVSAYISKCKKFELHIKNNEKDHPVYNENNEIEWEDKRINIFSMFDDEKMEERPFPTRNCPYFELGKKRY